MSQQSTLWRISNARAGRELIVVYLMAGLLLPSTLGQAQRACSPSQGKGWNLPFMAISPTGQWAALEDAQTGQVSIRRLPSGRERRLGRHLDMWPVRTPWSRQGDRLLLAYANGRSLVQMNLTTKRVIKLEPGGWLVGAFACVSPDGRFVAFGHCYGVDAATSIWSTIGVWNRAGPYTPKPPLLPTLPKFYRVPFRLSVEKIGWAGNQTLLVQSGGFNLGTKEEPYQQELHLLDVWSLRSRPIPLPAGSRVHDMSPYPDSTKGVALLVSTASRVALVRLDPATGTFAEVAEMPGGNVRDARGNDDPYWFLLWSNPDRLYIWRYDQGQDKIVMTYRPSRGSVTQPRRVALAGYLSADASGRIWGFKDRKIASVPPIN